MDIIVPRSISGFPEWLPEERIVELKLIDIIRSNFERYGFSPIETPAIENKEILLAKGGNDKEIYGLRRLTGDEEEEDREIALHFDLTVPLARYVAQNYQKLSFPFRRYQIQKVWRGERPQSGRFREFYQCDIDVIGDGELSLLTDAEIPSIIYRIFKEMNIGSFIIRINNRKILQGYLQSLEIFDEKIPVVLRLIDKLEKIGVQRVSSELIEITGLSDFSAKQLIEFASLDYSNEQIIKILRDMKVNEMFDLGVRELATVTEHMVALGVPEEYFRISIGAVRGLDYYTGTTYETVHVDHPGIGSICSGGRFDNLASYFTEKKLPGVGISIGLTRLFSRLLRANILQTGPSTPASVLVTSLDSNRIISYMQIATKLRDAGLNTEVYFEPKKISVQLKYANQKGFAFVVIAGSSEFEKGTVQLKNLKTGEQREISENNISSTINKELDELKRAGF